MRVYIGCGGYTNDDWAAPGLIYEGVRKEDYLGTYASHFDAVELNSSFYAIPGLKAFEGMARKSGGRVRFAVKLNKAFTHDRAPTDADFDRMLQSPEPLREADVERLGRFLAVGIAELAVGQQPVGQGHHLRGGAVVAHQPHDLAPRVAGGELQQVPRRGPGEGVDGLRGVADHAQLRRPGAARCRAGSAVRTPEGAQVGAAWAA